MMFVSIASLALALILAAPVPLAQQSAQDKYEQRRAASQSQSTISSGDPARDRYARRAAAGTDAWMDSRLSADSQLSAQRKKQQADLDASRNESQRLQDQKLNQRRIDQRKLNEKHQAQKIADQRAAARQAAARHQAQVVASQQAAARARSNQVAAQKRSASVRPSWQTPKHP